MRACFRQALISCAIAVSVVSLLAQTTVTHRTRQQPYTAEFKITQVQTLANGATITHESTQIEARDSQSRSMTSTTSARPYGGGTLTTMVNVSDPVAGTQSNWNSSSKKATVYKLPPVQERHGCWQSESGHFTSAWNSPGGAVEGAGAEAASAVQVHHPTPVNEDLGSTTIFGVEAHGHRITQTTPVGEIGNDQPLVSVTEYWSSPMLAFPLRELHDDPRTGTRDKELVNLTVADPDPSTFLPPEGYEVVIEEMVPCKGKSATLP